MREMWVNGWVLREEWNPMAALLKESEANGHSLISLAVGCHGDLLTKDSPTNHGWKTNKTIKKNIPCALTCSDMRIADNTKQYQNATFYFIYFFFFCFILVNNFGGRFIACISFFDISVLKHLYFHYYLVFVWIFFFIFISLNFYPSSLFSSLFLPWVLFGLFFLCVFAS